MERVQYFNPVKLDIRNNNQKNKSRNSEETVDKEFKKYLKQSIWLHMSFCWVSYLIYQAFMENMELI